MRGYRPLDPLLERERPPEREDDPLRDRLRLPPLERDRDWERPSPVESSSSSSSSASPKSASLAPSSMPLVRLPAPLSCMSPNRSGSVSGEFLGWVRSRRLTASAKRR